MGNHEMSQLQNRTARPIPVTGIWDIDPERSSVEFVTRQLPTRVRGRFAEFAGTIEVGADPVQSAAEVTLQAVSIDTDNQRRDAHLRRSFLDVERFPTLAFRSSRVRDFDGTHALRLDGDLTIRDVTNPVTLDVEYLGCSDDPWGGKQAKFSARTEINRDDFRVNWNMVLEIGGLLVGKHVQIKLDIEAALRTA